MDIKDYLHLYLGSEVKYKNILGRETQATLCADMFYHNEISLGAALLHGAKPILRPLSDIKEIEYDILASFTPDYLKGDGRIAQMEIDARRTAFLLSKHFDLFDLIGAGLAIDKTTIK